MKNSSKFSRGKHKILVLVLGILSLAMASHAQVVINGRVTGSEGVGLAGITVQVKNTNFGTATNSDGAYTLRTDLGNGNYVMVISGVGYKTKEESFTATGS